MSRLYAQFAGCLLVLIPVGARAGLIGPGDFSASVATVNFDSLSAGSVSSSNTDGDVITTQFAGLGVTFVNPNVHPTSGTPFQIYANNASYLELAFGTSFTAPNSAFIDLGGGSLDLAPIELHFSSPVAKVGFDYAISFASTISLTLLDSGGGILDSTTIDSSAGLSGFIGLESTAGVSRALIESRSTVINKSFNFNMDNLRFDAADVSTVPEPSSLVLLATGGVIGVVRMRRQRRVLPEIV